MDKNDTYLGDGLYANFDGYQINLYTHNGLRQTNAVYLEPSVLVAFERFVQAIRQAQQQPATPEQPDA